MSTITYVETSKLGFFFRTALAGFLCMLFLSDSTVHAGNCYLVDSNVPVSLSVIRQDVVVDRSGSGGSTVLQDDASIPSLSWLATASGPFESYRDARVTVEPDCDRWGGRDKLRHAAIFFATTLGLQLFIESTFNVSKTKAFLWSAAIGTAVGIAKEFYDSKLSDKKCFSEQDLVANTGGILGAGFVIMISH